MGLMPGAMTALVERPFKYAHLAWAALILALCAALLTAGGGHPPAFVFVPLVLLAGLVGHLLLLLIAWLLRRGRAAAQAAQPGRPGGWPVELVVIALVLGPFSLLAMALAAGELSLLHSRPLQWLVIAGVAVGHATAFVLLLLRIGATRYLLAMLSSGWGVALALQLREPRSAGELTLGLLAIGALFALALYIVRARRIRAALR